MEDVQKSQQKTKRTLLFKKQIPLEFGQELFIYGNICELREWDKSKSLQMTWNQQNIWSIKVEIPLNLSGQIYYKYLIADNGNRENIKEISEQMEVFIHKDHYDIAQNVMRERLENFIKYSPPQFFYQLNCDEVFDDFEDILGKYIYDIKFFTKFQSLFILNLLIGGTRCLEGCDKNLDGKLIFPGWGDKLGKLKDKIEDQRDFLSVYIKIQPTQLEINDIKKSYPNFNVILQEIVNDLINQQRVLETICGQKIDRSGLEEILGQITFLGFSSPLKIRKINELNALCCHDGKFIFINENLKELPNKEKLKQIIAHELAHSIFRISRKLNDPKIISPPYIKPNLLVNNQLIEAGYYLENKLYGVQFQENEITPFCFQLKEQESIIF